MTQATKSHPTTATASGQSGQTSRSGQSGRTSHADESSEVSKPSPAIHADQASRSMALTHSGQASRASHASQSGEDDESGRSHRSAQSDRSSPSSKEAISDQHEDALKLSLEATNAVLTASLRASKSLLEFMEQMQIVQTQALTGFNEALSEPEANGSLRELMSQQLKLTSNQFAQATKMSTSMISGWFEAETKLVKETQDQTSYIARKLLESSAAQWAMNGHDRSSGSPLEWLDNAQAAVSEMTQTWANSVKRGAARTRAEVQGDDRIESRSSNRDEARGESKGGSRSESIKGEAKAEGKAETKAETKAEMAHSH